MDNRDRDVDFLDGLADDVTPLVDEFDLTPLVDELDLTPLVDELDLTPLVDELDQEIAELLSPPPT